MNPSPIPLSRSGLRALALLILSKMLSYRERHGISTVLHVTLQSALGRISGPKCVNAKTLWFCLAQNFSQRSGRIDSPDS